MKQMLFSGQGKLRLALITAGVLGPYLFAGNVTAASISPSVSKTEHKESTSGFRAVDAVLFTESKVAFTATFEDHRTEMLAIALRSAVTENPGAPVVDHPLPAGLKAGDFVSLGGVNLSAIVVSDSTNAVLVLGTDYAIESAKHGTLQVLVAAKFTAAAKVSYTSGTSRSINVMSQTAKRYRLRFEGLNTAADNAPVLIEFEATLDPAKVLNMISNDFGSYEIDGDVLFVNGGYAVVTEID